MFLSLCVSRGARLDLTQSFIQAWGLQGMYEFRPASAKTNIVNSDYVQVLSVVGR